MLQTPTLKFLKDLRKNNNKAWFDKHRNDYETAKADFAAFIGQVLQQHAKKDKTIAALAVKDTLFRINRDVRFSKDKSPYKDNMGAYMARGGKKSVFGGYYFHLQPGQSFVGGGMWMPMPPALKNIRQEIDYNFPSFKKMIGTAAFKSVYGDLSRDPEYTLTRLPKGYEAENPAAEYLKLKSFVAIRKITDAELVSKDLVKITLGAFSALQPLVEFINEAVQPE